MDNTLSDALLLMFVGMTSVFTVLTIVVIGGNLLIKIVNRFSPAIAVDHKFLSLATQSNQIQKNKIAAITSVVTQVTSGKGIIDNISKL